MQPQISFYFPGYVRKSITFTIDDGNVPLDEKFLSIVNPAGIRGTFNLVSNLMSYLSPEGYRAFYRGHEISNHGKYHPIVRRDDPAFSVTDEPYDPVHRDPAKLYKTERDGLYLGWICRNYWDHLAEREVYLTLVREAQEELSAVFGEGTVRGYVWPNGLQKDSYVFQKMKEMGFYGLRKTGCVLDTTGFAMPEDRMLWSYNADVSSLLSCAALYEECSDDGQLKFFSFGVHSHDFERAGKWGDLQAFADLYGNRPQSYYYATVGELFDYEDAVHAAYKEGDALYNPSAIDLFITVDGERRILPAGASLSLL